MFGAKSVQRIVERNICHANSAILKNQCTKIVALVSIFPAIH